MRKFRPKGLLDYLTEIDAKEVKILFFKDIFDPLDLVSQLEPLSKLNLIEIDWENKVIRKNLTIGDCFKNKNQLKRNISKRPDYMSGEVIDINEPYI